MALDGAVKSMANFEAIATWVLEEQSVVSRSFVIARSFDLTGACMPDKRCNPVDFRRALGPKRDSAGIRLVQDRFYNPEKFRWTTRFDGFKLKPSIEFRASRETQRRQKRLVERPRLSQTAHAQVNVIESPFHLCDLKA
jgi:hypothetical protein